MPKTEEHPGICSTNGICPMPSVTSLLCSLNSQAGALFPAQVYQLILEENTSLWHNSCWNLTQAHSPFHRHWYRCKVQTKDILFPTFCFSSGVWWTQFSSRRQLVIRRMVFFKKFSNPQAMHPISIFISNLAETWLYLHKRWQKKSKFRKNFPNIWTWLGYFVFYICQYLTNSKTQVIHKFIPFWLPFNLENYPLKLRKKVLGIEEECFKILGDADDIIRPSTHP